MASNATKKSRRHSSAAAFNRAAGRRARHSNLLPDEMHAVSPDQNAYVDCGWGNLIFAQTFDDLDTLSTLVCDEAPHRRNIAFYVEEPHVALSVAPQDLFLDPSHTYRLWLAHYREKKNPRHGFYVRRLRDKSDADAINAILARSGMVGIPSEFLCDNRQSRKLTFLVAVEDNSDRIVGTVMGVDHGRAFNDPENGSSLWCLAVDQQCALPGIGETLVRRLAERFKTRGNSFMDLSVMHDNTAAIRLYEHLGFKRIPVFAVKHKNPINEKLFIAPQPEEELNPYAQIIINEARRRGIGVAIEDREAALFRLSFGGRTIHCRESLSDLTTAVAMTRCDDKSLTNRLLRKSGLAVPEQIEAGAAEQNEAFLEKHGEIVVKPARGEQGNGITVGVTDTATMAQAISDAKFYCERVILEQRIAGEDLRIVVIGNKVAAAATRRPAAVTGNGEATIRELIAAQSRRRAAATGGESTIPMDSETGRCVENAGYTLDSVLPQGETITVRRTANLHTGGTIHDVTDQLHIGLIRAAQHAAETLNIPVVGLDFIVESHRAEPYAIIEANERPGLANHEPQPTAERFIDLLFPQTSR